MKNTISRNLFVMLWARWLLFIGLFAITVASDAEHPTDSRILVLGAGMSGITTAKTLHEAGYKNLKIIEGASRVGGRMKGTQLGYHTVELGAMWIYGKGSNPIYDLAQRYNISMTDSFVDNWTVRDSRGKIVTERADQAHSKLDRIIELLDNKAKSSKQRCTLDLSVTSALRSFGWIPSTDVDDVIESYKVDFESGAPSNCLSWKHLNLYDTFEDFGNFEMVAITDKRGFSNLVSQMKDSFMPAGDERLLLNTTVTSIEHTDSIVRVTTIDGNVHEADFVVVTFSLGVLQQRSVKFIPPLPESKSTAIDKFGISYFTHIYIQFPNPFWDGTMYILHASPWRGRYCCWQNLNIVHPGSNALQVSLIADQAQWAERMTDEEIINDILATLGNMYRNITIPRPTDFKISRWISDPLTRGAYSYWPIGFTTQDHDRLRAPIGRVYFAGEHLHPLHYGFVHSAYLSGKQTATDLMSCIRDSGTCGRIPFYASYSDCVVDVNGA